jgi:hypothetical protein
VHHAISLQLHHGRSVVALLVDPWTLDRLLAFDAEVTDLEDADGEPEPDQEIDGPATVSDIVPPRRCCRICRKGQPCGDACISSTKPCKKEQGCACSAASAS